MIACHNNNKGENCIVFCVCVCVCFWHVSDDIKNAGVFWIWDVNFILFHVALVHSFALYLSLSSLCMLWSQFYLILFLNLYMENAATGNTSENSNTWHKNTAEAASVAAVNETIESRKARKKTNKRK